MSAFARNHEILLVLLVCAAVLVLGAVFVGGLVFSLFTLTSKTPQPAWRRRVAWAALPICALLMLSFVGLAIYGIAMGNQEPDGPAIGYVRLDTSGSGLAKMPAAFIEGAFQGNLEVLLRHCGYRIVRQGRIREAIDRQFGRPCDVECARTFARENSLPWFVTGTLMGEKAGQVATLAGYRTGEEAPVKEVHIRANGVTEFFKAMNTRHVRCDELIPDFGKSSTPATDAEAR